MTHRMYTYFKYTLGITAMLSLVLVGCNKDDDPANKNNKVKSGVQVGDKKDNNNKTIQAHLASLTKLPDMLPFENAVIHDPAPERELRPPDKTHTGKNVVRIYEAIANGMWDKLAFKNDGGLPIKYQAVIATDMGDVRIDLNHRAAPNHVRNFICLAKTGYFDGMSFYYSINRKVEDQTVAYIETGCPRGTGEFGSGSIGYWLKLELHEKAIHEEGVIGAARGYDDNSAACRFYLTAEAMPQMDDSFTVFGKITKGLDIVRAINKRETQDNDALKQPVTIRSVAIQAVAE